MSNAERRRQLQDSLWPDFLDRVHRYLQAVDTDGTVSDKQKAVEVVSKLLDLQPDKEALSQYPTVHITIGASGKISADARAAPVLEMVEEAARPPAVPAGPVPLFEPTPAMRRALGVNLDVASLLDA